MEAIIASQFFDVQTNGKRFCGVPKEYFLGRSSLFDRTQPERRDDSPRASSNIVYVDVHPERFSSLLRVMIHHFATLDINFPVLEHIGSAFDRPSASDYIHALTLATQWRMRAVRTLAIEYLVWHRGKEDVSPYRLLELAEKTSSVLLFLAGCQDIILAPEPMPWNAHKQIGAELAFYLSNIRAHCRLHEDQENLDSVQASEVVRDVLWDSISTLRREELTVFCQESAHVLPPRHRPRPTPPPSHPDSPSVTIACPRPLRWIDESRLSTPSDMDGWDREERDAIPFACEWDHILAPLPQKTDADRHGPLRPKDESGPSPRHAALPVPQPTPIVVQPPTLGTALSPYWRAERGLLGSINLDVPAQVGHAACAECSQSTTVNDYPTAEDWMGLSEDDTKWQSSNVDTELSEERPIEIPVVRVSSPRPWIVHSPEAESRPFSPADSPLSIPSGSTDVADASQLPASPEVQNVKHTIGSLLNPESDDEA